MAVEFHAGRWTFRYYREGRKGVRPRIVLPESITTKEEAEAYQELWRQRKRKARTDRTPSSTPLSQLWERYEREHLKLYLAPTTAKDAAGVWFLHLAPHFGPIVIGDLTDEDITAYITKRLAEISLRKDRPVKPRSINKELSYLAAFLTWCRDHAHVLFDEIRIRYLPSKRPVPLVLSFAEMAAFLRVAEPRYRALFGCLYGMGLRIKEVRALDWEHIDLVEAQALITDTKGGQPRMALIPSWLIGVLAAIRPEDPRGPVFPGHSSSGRFRDIRPAIIRACTAAKILKRVTPHLLRHTFATHHLQLETNLRKIQEMLGHSRLATTEWYTHATLAHLRTATDRFDSAMTAEMAKLPPAAQTSPGGLSPVAPPPTRKRRKEQER